MDGLFSAVSNDLTFQSHVTNIRTLYDPPTGDFVESMTLDGNEYAGAGNSGWQYRVYREAQNQSQKLPVPLSEVVGADSFKLLAGDTVVWAYGEYESEVLFPPYLPLPRDPAVLPLPFPNEPNQQTPNS